MTATLTRPALPPALTEGLDDPLPVTEAAPATEGAVKTKELVIVSESGDLERTWATTILASTAAAGEMKVSIFFTFWGLFSLVRPEVRVTGTNWMQKMLAMMNRPGIDHARLSKLNFAGMGPWMMKKLARQYGVAEPRELLEMAQALGVRLIPCQMSMDMMGISPDQLIDGVEPAVGAAAALELITNADASLFI
ncbi:MAG TPA: DsrE/DsrF/DrsH-like family protein [Candidatus Limnocylindria bacterium]|nr:DsrE/DsrF/DrsH-like family protein [Candidatus Limnocylindria bacterium]